MDKVKYEDLYDVVSGYIHNLADQERIYSAYKLADIKHKDQRRKSGEPYITHPLNVAIILAELQVGPDTIIAGLLHDVVEDTGTTLEEIKEHFGEDVADMVDGVTKLNKLKFNSLEEKQATNHQKMLLAMGRDIRVVVVKLADRLHNIRTIEGQAPEKRERICRETLEIYAPLAHKLGMFKIKSELEDRSLCYTDPERYQQIQKAIRSSVSSRLNGIEDIILEITKYLKSENMKDFSIKGRIKNTYSIYKKMINQNKEFEDIYDVIAVRVIVDTIDNCYRVLGLIHAHYTPVPKRFKDYIAVPKPNMYQSLHTTVISNSGLTFEVQIRTVEMDNVAELGIAAHWAYKENVKYSKEKEQFEIAQKLKWYAELLQFNEEDKEDAKTFVDSVKNEILNTSVYVYTPHGDVIDLPKGATPLDLAYKIHTQVGNTMSGATVNQKIVPIDYELKNGDIVSILTNKNSKGPSRDWLKIVKTNHARHKIKNFLNKQNRDVLLDYGKRAIDDEFKMQKISNYSLNDEFVSNNFQKYNVNKLEDLYVEVGRGTINEKTVVVRYQSLVKDERRENLLKAIEKNQKVLKAASDTGVIVEGLDRPQIKLATCCSPVPGDKIVGYISKGSGIIVHHANCRNLATLDHNRLIDVFWADGITRKYPVKLVITGNNVPSLMGEITNCLAQNNASISALKMKINDNIEMVVSVTILITNLSELERVMANLHKVNSVHEVTREI